MGCSSSGLAPSAAQQQLAEAVTTGDGEAALAALTSWPQLLSGRSTAALRLFPSSRATMPLHAACKLKQTRVVKDILGFLSSSTLPTVQAAMLPYCRRTGAPLPSTVADGVRTAVNMVNSLGQTPLMFACYFDCPELVTLLLAKGADPWARDRSDGRTALHYAGLGGSAATLRELLRNMPEEARVWQGCRYVDAASACGLTALHYCVHAGPTEALRELLYNRQAPYLHAATHSESYDERCVVAAGSSPLHFAAVRGDGAVALELLRYYDQRVVEEPSLADPRTRRDALGQTPYQVSALLHPADSALSALLHFARPLHTALRGALAAAPSQPSLGPPPLAALAAAALRAKLLAEVRVAIAAAVAAVAAAAAASKAGCGGRAKPPAKEARFLRVSSLVLGPSPQLPVVQRGCIAAPAGSGSGGDEGQKTTAAGIEPSGGRSCGVAPRTHPDGGFGGVDGGAAGCDGGRGTATGDAGGSTTGDRSPGPWASSGSGLPTVRVLEWDDEYGDREEEDMLCGLCFEAAVLVRPSGCGHGVCGGCAEALCGGLGPASAGGGARPLLCPFCRRSMPAFVPWAPRFSAASTVGP